jgi:hypothetical protein
VFHAVAKEAADLFAGAGPVRAGKGGDTPKHGFAMPVGRCPSPASHGIAYCANEFVELQEARHNADYDPTAKLTRADALQWVARVK